MTDKRLREGELALCPTADGVGRVQLLYGSCSFLLDWLRRNGRSWL